MGFLAVVALIAAAVSGLVPTSNNFVVASNATWQPTTLDAAETGYTTLMADGTLELEGIEDQATGAALAALGCDVGQGFAIARRCIGRVGFFWRAPWATG